MQVMPASRATPSGVVGDGGHRTTRGRTLVALLDEDPDLLGQASPDLAARARQQIVADLQVFPRGTWSPDWGAGREAIGLLVLDGFFAREAQVAGRRAVELVGAGDVLRSAESQDTLASLPVTAQWRVLQPTRLAVIDQRVHTSLCHLPGAQEELMGRAIRRSEALAAQLAIARIPRLEVRLHWLFWQLADRFGRRVLDGVRIPLRLTHELLSDLAVANRQAVTRALKRLTVDGLVEAVDNHWIVRHPPQLAPSAGSAAVLPAC
jgi:CRP-like cAMP-binding protein